MDQKHSNVGVDQEKGDYTPLKDEEDPKLGLYDKPLPCFGCGIGWFSNVVLCDDPILLQLLPEGSQRKSWTSSFCNCCNDMYSCYYHRCGSNYVGIAPKRETTIQIILSICRVYRRTYLLWRIDEEFLLSKQQRRFHLT
ncbi:uncharacterized protein LOC116201733 isoform X1 [Punica granatum]|uniref:Uncharacterized protein LOC116201733 isoform X1 n=1 Tax=Punica granatum TaxID=22663 RepID=A0A6P8CW60_PUNGR|nr:uncharacterized protein LOC116201733 isoform X1 [Punica granatum]XP_031388985.1 uncharacterized protein LOC116201733 isoform X1 [Punica granatum]XP_031388986.1 uncharacterized protein LOC116201733 isoform X1 [Punica granatum]XP_031388987.1 uncharacterized protein LOC116201733 isoform X1 [Punica granatum]XP_031388988.1 uncharacterized protein LOC116201733 isoform X1 [Punica granatum]XP_031388989.1 uncharacterized protein LOC116201733 isoform X1 [Punica granatum]XP_031388990.1 uncharacterize